MKEDAVVDDETTSSNASKERWVYWTTIGTFAINTAGLVLYHIRNPDNSGTDISSTNNESTTDDIPIHSAFDKILFGALVLMAFQLLDFLTKNSGLWLQSSSIPVRGKHLDELRRMDILCIGFSMANTAPFTYFFLRYCWTSLLWDVPHQMNLSNTLVPLPFLFLLFDFTYASMHSILHWQCLYPYIHKHHHIQKAPSRANVDAVNVHPIEFILGEYNHLLVVYVWTRILHQPLHVVSAFAFLVVGGILAGINHTRYDVTISLPFPRHWLGRKEGFQEPRIDKLSPNSIDDSSSSGMNIDNYWAYIPIYDSKAHDVHHRIPQSNYGQYTMFWDYIFGSYRAYNPKDRINPHMQLTVKATVDDPKSQ